MYILQCITVFSIDLREEFIKMRVCGNDLVYIAKIFGMYLEDIKGSYNQYKIQNFRLLTFLNGLVLFEPQRRRQYGTEFLNVSSPNEWSSPSTNGFGTTHRAIQRIEARAGITLPRFSAGKDAYLVLLSTRKPWEGPRAIIHSSWSWNKLSDLKVAIKLSKASWLTFIIMLIMHSCWAEGTRHEFINICLDSAGD